MIDGSIIMFGSLLAQGGWPMLPLYICSLVAVAVFLYKLMTYRAASLFDLSWQEDILRLIHLGDMKAVSETCNRFRHPAMPVVRSVVHALNERPDLAESEARRVASIELQKLEKYLSLLSFIAQVAPLLGLLGTVIGMVDLFIGFQGSNSADINISKLSSGIWKALITTAAGLTIAVPTLAAHSYLTSRVDNVRLQLSDVIQRMMYIAPRGINQIGFTNGV